MDMDHLKQQYFNNRNATNQEEITIGRPINNTQIYILNKK